MFPEVDLPVGQAVEVAAAVGLAAGVVDLEASAAAEEVEEEQVVVGKIYYKKKSHLIIKVALFF